MCAVLYTLMYHGLVLPSRIQDKITENPITGCWEWTAAKTVGGYGITHWRDAADRPKTGVAHRHIYQLLVGHIPEGMYLDHLCRVRHCVNPAHLEVVTHRENTMRGESFIVAKALQTHCVNGHPFDDQNTAIEAGRRKCIECRRRRCRESYVRRKARKTGL